MIKKIYFILFISFFNFNAFAVNTNIIYGYNDATIINDLDGYLTTLNLWVDLKGLTANNLLSTVTPLPLLLETTTGLLYDGILQRIVLVFNTNELGPNAEILAATLNLKHLAPVTSGLNDQYSYVQVVSADPIDIDNLAIEDFQLINVNLQGSETVSVSTMVQGTYTAFPLNSTGLSWINKEGYTNFGLAFGYDIENVCKPVDSDLLQIVFYSKRNNGVDNDPYLEITYIPWHGSLVEKILQAK